MEGKSNVHGQNGISHDDEEIIRPLANFSPSLWADLFLDYTPPDSATENEKKQEICELKEEVRKHLLNYVKDPKESLLLINAIQRLGVAHYFEEQIEAILQHFHNYEDAFYHKDDLLYASLHFRLFRQHGFFLSSDLFNKFVDENGSFKDSLKSDLQGILCLYEASDVRLRREKVLEEALAFTTTHLTSMASSLSCDDPLGAQISHALNRPFYKCTNRLEAKFQIPLYELDASHNQSLLRLAKLDFNMLQSQHKKELSDLIRWARSFDFTGKFPFSRDVLAESYIWALGVCYEPEFSYVRTTLIKVLQIMTVINDTYDAYGTIQELETFTEAILSWDNDSIHQLPDYMKLIYQILLDTFQEFEQDQANKSGRSCSIDYMQRELKNSCRAYLQEARWCNKNYTPPYDEYIKNGMVSSIYGLLLMAVYHGMGEIATKDELEWIYKNSNAMKSSRRLARLWADMGGHKFERKRKHVDSAVECYKASFGVSEEEAYKELLHQVEEAWMDLKEEMLRPTAMSMRLLTPITNMCRALYDMYKIGEDAFNMPITVRDKVQALLIDPII